MLSFQSHGLPDQYDSDTNTGNFTDINTKRKLTDTKLKTHTDSDKTMYNKS